MKMKKLVLDANILGMGLGNITGIKVKVKGKIDGFDEELSPDGELINENNIDGYDGEGYFSSPDYFCDQTLFGNEMWDAVNPTVDKEASEEYFISMKKESFTTDGSYATIGLEDVEIRDGEVILTMTVDVVYYNEENSPGGS